jgi:hypothetical protein
VVYNNEETLLTFISLGCKKSTVSSIITDTSKFDGKKVCTYCLGSNFKLKASKRRGKAYIIFGLNEEGKFLWGFSNLRRR